MDPNANLAKQIEHALFIYRGNGSEHELACAAEQLAELVIALNDCPKKPSSSCEVTVARMFKFPPSISSVTLVSLVIGPMINTRKNHNTKNVVIKITGNKKNALRAAASVAEEKALPRGVSTRSTH